MKDQCKKNYLAELTANSATLRWPSLSEVKALYTDWWYPTAQSLWLRGKEVYMEDYLSYQSMWTGKKCVRSL